jgi:hypothetical protein
VRHRPSGARQPAPSPTDQDPPAMLAKRTTQALVAQGIEHRFPKRALAVPSPPASQSRFALLVGESAVLMPIFGIPLNPVQSSRLQHSADHTRDQFLSSGRLGGVQLD